MHLLAAEGIGQDDDVPIILAGAGGLQGALIVITVIITASVITAKGKMTRERYAANITASVITAKGKMTSSQHQSLQQKVR